jgi:acetyl esterase/lipase
MDGDEGARGVVRLPARKIPPPVALSEQARAVLAAPTPPPGTYPAFDDHDGWRRLIASRDRARAAESAAYLDRLQADVAARVMGGAPVYVATPRGERLRNRSHVLLDIHGGALLFGGGEANVRFSAASMALRTGCVAYSLDYRVPPDHPYPAALDDCMAVYKALLAERPAQEIVFCGASAGGNLAAALVLRARDEGLPLPAGVILRTPELDLTESGDSFHTLMGLDVVLPAALMEVNLVYAGGADLAHPYLSPLFGDFAGFPPTWLQAGGRDIFLSNTIRMHRRLRNAGVRAELHVWEGMPHGGFGGLTPEDREMNMEMQAFVASLA